MQTKGNVHLSSLASERAKAPVYGRATQTELEHSVTKMVFSPTNLSVLSPKSPPPAPWDDPRDVAEVVILALTLELITDPILPPSPYCIMEIASPVLNGIVVHIVFFSNRLLKICGFFTLSRFTNSWKRMMHEIILLRTFPIILYVSPD